MSRAERLLELMQQLRRHRFPVKGVELADTLGISLRTLYRDIRSLQSQGALIEGEPGLGYILRPGFTLPPLMFSSEEIEALSLGARWVAERADEDLSLAAKNALAKISAVLSPELRLELDSSGLLIGPKVTAVSAEQDKFLTELAAIRRAINAQHKLDIIYADLSDKRSERVIWPFALGFFDAVYVIVAWCELRQEIRHFRVDRLISLNALEQRYPRSRHQLLQQWRKQQNISQS